MKLWISVKTVFAVKNGNFVVECDYKANLSSKVKGFRFLSLGFEGCAIEPKLNTSASWQRESKSILLPT
ncbi:MAG: hypothetical protein P2A85_00480 [Microcoleus anatoxicus]|uniref:hypothetical protein n=1 Tax=Microcoleus anatoxicus TaxID=2705319 RepID=UPI00366A8D0A